MVKLFRSFSFTAITLLLMFSFHGCKSSTLPPLENQALNTASPSYQADSSPKSTQYASVSLYLGAKQTSSTLDGVIKDDYKGTQSKCDSLGTYAYKLENGSLFTVLISSGNLAANTEIGYALINQTSSNAFLALWRINSDYTVCISGSNVTIDEMTAFLNDVCK